MQVFIGLACRTVGGQVCPFDERLPAFELGLDRLAVVNSQVVHALHELAPARRLDAPVQEIAEGLRSEGALVDHAAHLALMGHAAEVIDP